MGETWAPDSDLFCLMNWALHSASIKEDLYAMELCLLGILDTEVMYVMVSLARLMYIQE